MNVAIPCEGPIDARMRKFLETSPDYSPYTDQPLRLPLKSPRGFKIADSTVARLGGVTYVCRSWKLLVELDERVAANPSPEARAAIAAAIRETGCTHIHRLELARSVLHGYVSRRFGVVLSGFRKA